MIPTAPTTISPTPNHMGAAARISEMRPTPIVSHRIGRRSAEAGGATRGYQDVKAAATTRAETWTIQPVHALLGFCSASPP